MHNSVPLEEPLQRLRKRKVGDTASITATRGPQRAGESGRKGRGHIGGIGALEATTDLPSTGKSFYVRLRRQRGQCVEV